MLFDETPIGYVQIPSWLEEELQPLTDEQLLQRAWEENRHFVISPATFAMIEKRQLLYRLQKGIDPHVGVAAMKHKYKVK